MSTSNLLKILGFFLGPSESLSSQKTPADGNKPNTQLANTKGSNLGLAGPPGAFPLMVAAETLAASFGVHMNRIQTAAGVGGESVNTRSPISLKKSTFVTSKSGSCSAPLQPPPHVDFSQNVILSGE
ncbi:hypothetical protein ACTXT7_005769 [Hymenolepis weldensis]